MRGARLLRSGTRSFRATRRSWSRLRGVQPLSPFPRTLTINRAQQLSVLSRMRRMMKPSDNDNSEKKSDGENPSKKASLGATELKRIWHYSRPELSWLLSGTGFMAVSTGVTMVVPAAFGRVIDVATGVAGGISLETLSLGLGGVFVIGGMANAARIYCFSRVGHCVVARIRRDVFNSLTAQELGYFEKNPSGDLVSRLTNDTSLLGESFGGLTLCAAMRNLAQVTGSFSLMAYLSPELTKVTLFLIPLGATASILYGRFIHKTQVAVQQSVSEMTGFADERLSQMKLVRSFGNEEYERAQFKDKYLMRVFNSSMIQTRGSSLFFGSTGAVGNLFMLAVLSYGGAMVHAGTMSSGTLTSFLMYTLYVGMSVIGFTSNFTSMMRGVGASQKVFEIIDRRPSIDSGLGIALSTGSLFHSLYLRPHTAAALSSSLMITDDELRQSVDYARSQGLFYDDQLILHPSSEQGASVMGRRPAATDYDFRISDIEFENVHFKYPTRDDGGYILQGLNLSIKEGQSLAIVGESGSGKSTLFSLLMRMYDIDGGSIKVRLRRNDSRHNEAVSKMEKKRVKTMPHSHHSVHHEHNLEMEGSSSSSSSVPTLSQITSSNPTSSGMNEASDMLFGEGLNEPRPQSPPPPSNSSSGVSTHHPSESITMMDDHVESVSLDPSMNSEMSSVEFDRWIDLHKLRPLDIRAQIASVPQESSLFNGSIRDNLCYGLIQPVRKIEDGEYASWMEEEENRGEKPVNGLMERMIDKGKNNGDPLSSDLEKGGRVTEYEWLKPNDVPMDRIINVCQLANAHDFISEMSDNYDTEVTNSSLSGGQKQRLSIARAILKEPEILLLDEATSALDAQSEALVADALSKAMSGRTSIVIAHRLSTIRQCDSIAVIHGGKIVERGTHQELMALNNYYADLVRRQLH